MNGAELEEMLHWGEESLGAVREPPLPEQQVYEPLLSLSAVGIEYQSLGTEVDFDLFAFFELALQYLLG
jgi:hypothetical protein